MKKFFLCILVMCGFCLFVASSVSAYSFDFYKLEQNTSLPGAQFSGTLEEDNGGVVFTFYNLGPSASRIKAVYFDDQSGLLGEISSLTQENGVVKFDWEEDAGSLPGGQNLIPPFPKKADFYAEVSGGAVNGVDPGQSLEIFFDLVAGGASYDDVVAAMIAQDLRIGIHVGSIDRSLVPPDGSDSDSFSTIPAVPEPATMLLLGTGLIGLAGFGRKKLFKK